MNLILKYCIIVFFVEFSFLNLTNAQHVSRIGVPYVQQYNKAVYKGGNQNWGLAVSPQGVIYAANTSGLLRFDGQQWRLYHHDKKTLLRSVNIAQDGKIFTGGLGEFGFWTDKGFGNLIYTSLIPLIDNKNALQNDEIWRILIDGNRVIFQSFSKAYLYENNQISLITALGEPFMFAHLVGNNLYFEQLPSGLHIYQEGGLAPINNRQLLMGKNVLCMLPFDQESTLIGTSKDGLYMLTKHGDIHPWANEAQLLFKQYQINNGVKVSDSLYAFGTIQNGVIIVNNKGELIQHINKNNGLQNNTVLSLTVDKQSNLWVGLDNGIDRIDILSPFYYFSDLTGEIGTVYSSVIHKGKIYLGSNQGLFVGDWNNSGNHSPLQFRMIPHSAGQVWQLAVIDDVLYCGHNNGTYEVDGNQLKPISPITGGWNMYPLSNPNYLLQGNYTGLSLFDRRTSPIRHIVQYPNVKEPVKFIAEESPTSVWIGNNNELKLIHLSPDLSEIQKIDQTPQGVPNARLYGIHRLGNSNVLATDSGFYRYDDVVKKFILYKELNEQLGTFSTSNMVKNMGDSQYWLFKSSHIAHVTFDKNGDLSIDSSTWNPLRDRMMNEYENILQIDQNTDLIGLDNGFALYMKNTEIKKDIPSPLITGFWNITHELHSIESLRIPYNQNNIRISYSLPWYSSADIKFQFRLEGYIDTWSEWDVISYKDFTNLPHGEYTFQVRAISPTGSISEISELHFAVLRPWYWSWTAIVFYALFLIALIIFLQKWYNTKIQSEQDELRRKLQDEQKAALAKEVEMNERRLMSLKNEKLEQELAIKNRELANAAMNIVYKNEMLNSLHDELTKIKDANGNKLNQDQLKKVNKLIDEAHSDDRDWNLFEKSFNESHENFFKKLKAEYPELVPNDLKLCAYLRLNMSSKEIASLLNISLRGVEIRRYRLRKKLNLPTNKNLTEFLLEF